MSQLELIKQKTAELHEARANLTCRMTSLKEEVESIQRRHMQGIIDAANVHSDVQDELHILIDINPELFKKPRTHVFNGIRVGYQKGKGVLKFTDGICKLIKKKLPEQYDSLVKVTEKPISKALSNLSVAELKSIGVTVTNTADQIVIKHVNGEIDKLVDAFLAEAEQFRQED